MSRSLLLRGVPGVALAALAWACEHRPTDAGGDLLGAPLGYRGTTLDLAWVAGTRSVVFRAPATDSTTCAVTAVDVDTRVARVLDRDCSGLSQFTGNILHGLVVSDDGGTIAYQVGVASDGPGGGAVRTVSLAGGSPIEQRRVSRLWPAVAVSGDGRLLAYGFSLDDSLVVRDVASGAESRIDGGLPIAFSPDGGELLYYVGSGLFARRPLAGLEQIVHLALNPGDSPGPLTWDASGLWAAIDRFNGGYVSRNVASGEEVRISEFDLGKRVRSLTWLRDGRRVAFWEEYCHEMQAGSPCVVDRSVLIVADRATGARTRVADGPGASGPIAFSSDSREVVYGFAGELYLASVP